MEDRNFGVSHLDRVARIPNTSRPTEKFEEAIQYARHRAWATGKRQTLRRKKLHKKGGVIRYSPWFLVLASDEPIPVKEKAI